MNIWLSKASRSPSPLPTAICFIQKWLIYNTDVDARLEHETLGKKISIVGVSLLVGLPPSSGHLQVSRFVGMSYMSWTFRALNHVVICQLLKFDCLFLFMAIAFILNAWHCSLLIHLCNVAKLRCCACYIIIAGWDCLVILIKSNEFLRIFTEDNYSFRTGCL